MGETPAAPPCTATMANPFARLEKEGMSKDKIEEYMAAFELFDVDRKGVITTAKLKAVLNDTFGVWRRCAAATVWGAEHPPHCNHRAIIRR